MGDSYGSGPAIIQASAAKTATGIGTAVAARGHHSAVEFQLDLTAAATDVGDTLDVFVQTTLDDLLWVDVVHFSQILGNGGVKLYRAKLIGVLAETMFENAAALGAAAIRHLLGTQYRVRWVIVDADANASFTFALKAFFVSSGR